MEMTKVYSGKLRAIGYDIKTNTLRVELDEGSTLEYSSVSETIWRNLKNASAQWSYYRDNIEEVFSSKRVSSKTSNNIKNPLDDLFK